MTNFDTWAQDFDTARRQERARLVAEKIAAHMGEEGGKSAMEYGCGTGLIGLQLLDRLSSLLFVDSSRGMLERVERKLAGRGGAAASVYCGDLLADASFSGRFDLIFSSMALHHVRDTEALLRRFFGLLARGGRILLVDLDQDDGSFHAEEPDFDGHNGFAQAQLRELCARAGYRDVAAATWYRAGKLVAGREVPYSLFLLRAEKP